MRIEIANRIRGGRSAGTDYVVTRSDEQPRRTSILARFATRDQAEAYLAVPDLPPHCGSWIVTRRSSGEVIGEFYDRANVAHFNPATCLIETADRYLGRINGKIAERKG